MATAWAAVEVSLLGLWAAMLLSGEAFFRVLGRLTGTPEAHWWALGATVVLMWAGDLLILALGRAGRAARGPDGRPAAARTVLLVAHVVPGLPVVRRALLTAAWLAIQTAYLSYLLLWDVAVVLLLPLLRFHGPSSKALGRVTDVTDRFRERLLSGLDRTVRATAACGASDS